jgi:hypothetical protein
MSYSSIHFKRTQGGQEGRSITEMDEAGKKAEWLPSQGMEGTSDFLSRETIPGGD